LRILFIKGIAPHTNTERDVKQNIQFMVGTTFAVAWLTQLHFIVHLFSDVYMQYVNIKTHSSYSGSLSMPPAAAHERKREKAGTARTPAGDCRPLHPLLNSYTDIR
jgi:hypothetical protein